MAFSELPPLHPSSPLHPPPPPFFFFFFNHTGPTPKIRVERVQVLRPNMTLWAYSPAVRNFGVIPDSSDLFVLSFLLLSLRSASFSHRNKAWTCGLGQCVGHSDALVPDTSKRRDYSFETRKRSLVPVDPHVRKTDWEFAFRREKCA